MSNEFNRDELVALAGGSPTKAKFKVPLIKFNGSTGKFQLLPLVDGKYDALESLPDNLEMVILRPRRQYAAFEKEGEVGLSYYSSEHNTWEDVVTLFRKEKGGKAKVVGTDTGAALREIYPTIRLNAVLYVLFNGEVHKLVAKGMSRKNFTTYRDKLAADNKMLFDYVTKISSKQEAGTGFSYSVMNFDAGAETKLEEIGTFIQLVGTSLNQVDEQYAKAKNSRGSAEKGEELPIVDVEEVENDEEIKMSEIPF